MKLIAIFIVAAGMLYVPQPTKAGGLGFFIGDVVDSALFGASRFRSRRGLLLRDLEIEELLREEEFRRDRRFRRGFRSIRGRSLRSRDRFNQGFRRRIDDRRFIDSRNRFGFRGRRGRLCR